MNPNQCSFCGRKKSEVEILISGQNGFICENCVEQAHAIVKKKVYMKMSFRQLPRLKNLKNLEKLKNF